MKLSFDVQDVKKANIVTYINSAEGKALYKLQCHSAGYVGDPDFDYSGDFECRLSIVDNNNNTYSTLLTENLNQTRDWESRARFFATDLRGACAHVPQFGTKRSFELRGMTLTLHITHATFTNGGVLRSLKLTVQVIPNPNAQRPIAKIVQLPQTSIPSQCRLNTYFVDPKSFSER